ncbi:hypothetical protein TWF225_002744 [Orbilia oligospora]|nr:hypothetical protein TWF225_002744 [Orbilia oligospora]KAF3253727.1 hypothetical protein TWF128_006350 [Orbilia oligospora]
MLITSYRKMARASFRSSNTLLGPRTVRIANLDYSVKKEFDRFLASLFGEMFLKIVLIPPGVLSARRRVDRSVSIALGIVPAACTLRSSIPAACNLMQSIVNAAKPAASAVATEPPVILTDSSDPISTSSPGNNSSGTSVWLNFNVEWRKEQS